MAAPISDHTLSKTALRARFRTYRRQLTPAQYALQSAAIVERLKNLPEIAAAKTVHVFWPMIERHEVDIRPLTRWLLKKDKQIVLPAVLDFNGNSGEGVRMEHRPFRSENLLLANRWGIHEPSEAETVPLDAIDLVIVPALGADRRGYRIGQGLGFYDELLSQMSVSTVCPVYGSCLVDILPIDPHDVPISILVTEQEVIRPYGDVTS